jgi:DNA-binding NarL/FixJ family response regulator
MVVDNHPVMRAGIRALLQALSGVEVVGEASNGLEAIEQTRQLTPDLVFMDIAMPVLSGLEATERMLRDWPKLRVIILSRLEEEEYLWGALKKGAAGFIVKRAAPDELEKALRCVAAGNVYLSPELSARLKANPPEQASLSRGPIEQLTDRQCEILQLIAEGHNTKEIAAILKVSPKTVDFHRAKLMERLNIHDVPGLVRLALREKLVK